MKTKHEYRLIAIKDVRIDRSYQRDLDQGRINKIAQTFDRSLFGVPVVSERANGEFFVVDGQHRIMAAREAGFGNERVTMEVQCGLSHEQEAQLFIDLNKYRRGIDAFGQFKARIQAKEPQVLEILSIVKKAGCYITRNTTKVGSIRAVTAVEYAYRRNNLDKTLQTLFGWLDGSAEAFDGVLIRGVSNFYVKCPDAKLEHFTSRLQTNDPKKILNRIRRSEAALSCSKIEASLSVFQEIYNHRLPQRLRLVVAA